MTTPTLEEQPLPPAEYQIYAVGFDSYAQTWSSWDIVGMAEQKYDEKGFVTALDIGSTPITLGDSHLFSRGLAIGTIPEEPFNNIDYIEGDIGMQETWESTRTWTLDNNIEGFDFAFFRPLGGVDSISEVAVIKTITEGINLLNEDGHFFGHLYLDRINSHSSEVRMFLEKAKAISPEGLSIDFHIDKVAQALTYHIHREKVTPNQKQELLLASFT
ncbi:hypothetical protein GF389_00765 [Candidatus Dojkabacteria bacterium]|nr:hypothetical protein [Candidatus Dojkabacteria bacterium]